MQEQGVAVSKWQHWMANSCGCRQTKRWFCGLRSLSTGEIGWISIWHCLLPPWLHWSSRVYVGGVTASLCDQCKKCLHRHPGQWHCHWVPFQPEHVLAYLDSSAGDTSQHASQAVFFPMKFIVMHAGSLDSSARGRSKHICLPRGQRRAYWRLEVHRKVWLNHCQKKWRIAARKWICKCYPDLCFYIQNFLL